MKMNNRDVERTVVKALGKALNLEEYKIDLDSHIVGDLGCWGEMDGINIIVEIQRAFKIELAVKDIDNVITVRDLVHKVESLIQ